MNSVHWQNSIISQFPHAEKLIKDHEQRILDQATANVGSKDAGPLLDELEKIVLGATENGICPFATKEMEEEPLRNILKYLVHNIPYSSEHMWDCSTIYALIAKCTPEQKVRVVDEIQKILKALFNQLLIRQNTGQPEAVIETLLGHILCFYSHFLALDEHAALPERVRNITIPQKVRGEWYEIKYEVSEIMTLTPACMYETIQAIGLRRTEDEQMLGPPLLLFKGSRGVVSFLTDFTPGCSVGELAYWLGKDKLNTWLDSAKKDLADGQKIIAYGMSLGAALAMHTANDHADHVEFRAYAAPGLFARNLTNQAKMEGVIYKSPSDCVSWTGYYPDSEKVRVVDVIRPDSTCALTAHVRAYGGESTLLLRINAVWENQRWLRLFANIVHQIISVPLFLITALAIGLYAAYYHITELFTRCWNTQPEPILLSN